MWHKTLVFSKTHARCACILGQWKEVKYLTKKWKRYDFALSQNANFLVTDEQELIQLWDSHEIPLSFSVASFVVNSKTIQSIYWCNWETFQRKVLKVNSALGWYYRASVNDSPQRLIKSICAFIMCYGICSNIWALSFAIVV